MENIWNYNNIDFSNIKLRMPKPLQGGTYFSKIESNGNPILIQTPKCLTKNGIHKTGKKIYVDLKFSLDDQEIVDWLSKFENQIKSLIYEKKDLWFHDEPTEDEIDYLWSESIRNNKDSYLLRSYIQRTNKLEQIQIWDEDESELTLDDIDAKDNLISIIELAGLKFTSQSFCIELYLRQIVVIKDKPIFNKCLIKINKNKSLNIQLEKTKSETVEKKELIEEHDEEPIKETVEETFEEPVEEPIKETVEESVEEPIKETVEETFEEPVEELNGNDINSINEEKKHNNEEKNYDEENNNLIDTPNIKLETNKDNIKEKNITKNEKIESDVSDIINEKKDDTLVKNEKLLKEFELKLPDDSETISLKTPRDVYLDIYRKARRKALDAKKEAIKAFLDAKRIKETYLLDQYDNDSEEEDFLKFIEKENTSENV